jgi:hypothetical protein
MLVRATAWALLSVVVAVGSVPAQQVAFAATVVAELDSATLAVVTRELARARERGIPVEPLVAKAREGRLKRATGDRIRYAVAALAARLDSARSALGPASTPDELVAGADAIAAGADIAALRALRAATVGSLAAPAGTLAQLCATGVAPKRAVEMIVALLKRNATPAQLIALGNQVETDVTSGLLPDESAAVRMRGVEAALGGFGDKVEVSAPAASQGFNQRPPTVQKPTRRP